MQVLNSLADILSFAEQSRQSGRQIGFVPTMGALHDGHLALLRAAQAANDVVVCSIFVNPTQFNNPEDFRLYPRLLAADARVLQENGCDVLFAPEADAMYPAPMGLSFNFGLLEKVMEGEFRPGHFSGVAAVVAKLLHLVKPHRAYFGQKDLQQFAIISQLVRDLNFDLELVCHPIVREADGLAMSSRNRRLSAGERREAVQLYKGLQLAQSLLPGKTVPEVKKAVTGYLHQFPLIKLEYFEVVDPDTLQPLVGPASGQVALCIAAYLGEVRLIDNLVLKLS